MEIFAEGNCKYSALKTFAHTFTEVHNKEDRQWGCSRIMEAESVKRIHLEGRTSFQSEDGGGIRQRHFPTAIEAEADERKVDLGRFLTHSFGKLVEIAQQNCREAHGLRAWN